MVETKFHGIEERKIHATLMRILYYLSFDQNV